MQYWYRVLKHFELSNYFVNGLTLPFLIGSRKIVEPSEPIYSILEFVEEITNNEINITLMKCDNIGEYVFGIIDNETKNIKDVYKVLYKEFGSLVITDNSFSNLKSILELVKKLEELYGQLILDCSYSKTDGVWDDFTPEDKKRLKEIKK